MQCFSLNPIYTPSPSVLLLVSCFLAWLPLEPRLLGRAVLTPAVAFPLAPFSCIHCCLGFSLCTSSYWFMLMAGSMSFSTTVPNSARSSGPGYWCKFPLVFLLCSAQPNAWLALQVPPVCGYPLYKVFFS